MIQSYVVVAYKDNGEKTYKNYSTLKTAVTATRYIAKSKVYSEVSLFIAYYQSERKVKQCSPNKIKTLWRSVDCDIEDLNKLNQNDCEEAMSDGNLR